VNDPAAPPLAMPSAPYERWTRRLGRFGAGLLMASILLPQLWLDADGRPRVHWIWQERSDLILDSPSAFYLLEGRLSPGGAMLLVVGVLAWVAASFEPLVRRGR
jgi:hypothetical protein